MGAKRTAKERINLFTDINDLSDCKNHGKRELAVLMQGRGACQAELTALQGSPPPAELA